MQPRERVERALRGEPVDRVPFTMYPSMIPQCSTERELRNRGLCIVKGVPAFKTRRPHVKETALTYWDGDREMVRRYLETPYGALTTLHEVAGFTNWYRERMFKRPEDYAALLFLIQDEVYEPTYDAFLETQEALGPDFIARAGFGLEPLQSLITGQMMDIQDFCVEWMDRRDEVLRLYSAIVANHRRLYSVVAASPALHANYGGNVIPEIVSPAIFRQYYSPHYNEAAEVMHAHGKLVGCHFDDDCKSLAPVIAQTDLDYIEAFTPAPDTNMTLGEARVAWPGKVLWLNFPSSLHLRPDAEVVQATVGLLSQLDSCRGLLMAITEDVPANRWQGSCRAIMDGLERHAREHPERY
jgi:hypothetical protein